MVSNVITKPSRYPSVQAQLIIGKRGEQILDEFFGQNYHIKLATKQQENELGIDRIFTNKFDGRVCTVEYKFDIVAARTRNAFVEITSNVEENRPGWANKCQADQIAYLVGENQIFLFSPKTLRERLNIWFELFPGNVITKRFKNNSWHTKGLLLPLNVLATISYIINF